MYLVFSTGGQTKSFPYAKQGLYHWAMPHPCSLPSLGIVIVRESPSGEIAESEECVSSSQRAVAFQKI